MKRTATLKRLATLRPPRTSFGCLGAFGCLTIGLVFLALGFWATHLYLRFTPVYTDIVCHFAPPQVSQVEFEGKFRMQVLTKTTCDNPNPYGVHVESTKAGEIYMGEDRKPMAAITQIPRSVLPPQARGSISATVTLEPGVNAINTAFDLLGAGAVPVWIENNLVLDISINFLFAQFNVKKPFNKDCGMKVKMDTFMKPVTGPVVCADDWKSLKLKDVPEDAQPKKEMRLKAVSLAGHEIKKAQTAKTAGLGAAMAVFFGVGLVFTAFGSLFLIRQKRLENEAESEENESDVPSTKDIKIQEVPERGTTQEV